MGASDSKLVFKQGIFKLSERRDIPADDVYWASFWELPETVEDIFSLFSVSDIRRIRDQSLGNLETLILAVTSRLCALRKHPSFPNPETAPERDALNCIRVLTRVLPFIYEAEHLAEWEERFFWGTRRRRKNSHAAAQARPEVLFDEATPRHGAEEEQQQRQQRQQEQEHNQGDDAEGTGFEETKPLAEELIDVLIDLLFFADFSIPAPAGSKNKVSLSIWQSGVGCNNPVGSSPEFENRRMEVLRLLLTLASKAMYTSANILPVQGVRAITYIATIQDKPLVLTLLCSLLNTTLKYNHATWRVPYDHVVFKDPKQMYVTYCLQLLLVLVVYPVPELSNGVPPKNSFRHFLGKLHRPQDFQFLVDGMTRILNQPLQASASYLPGSQKSLSWAPEMIMLFWEVLQCNKRFRSFIVDTDRAQDFVILVIFYAMQNKHETFKQGIARMCIFVLQTLSVEPSFGERLNKPFQGQESLPQVIRIPDFRGSYTDFLIISIYTLLTSGKGKLDAIYPALLAIINNVAPYIVELSSAASVKLLQLYATMSSPAFMLANETNHDLLKSLLEAINAIVEHQYEKNATFVYSILRSEKRFRLLQTFVDNGGEAELERHVQQRKTQGEELERIRSPSLDTIEETNPRSPGGIARTPTLSNVPEESGAFAIGDDEDDSDMESLSKATSVVSYGQSAQHSRAGSESFMSESTAAAEDAVPTQTRGLSEKARGKLPANQPSFSRQSSSASLSSMSMANFNPARSFEPDKTWIATWAIELPLHTCQTLLDQLMPQVPLQGTSTPSSAMLSAISRANVTGIDRSPIRVHLFEWSPLSLGWYESLLWSLVFTTEMAMPKGAPGIWKGTIIRLFRVQETVAAGPSLMSPQGAVDAVGSNLVKRIGSLNLRGSSAGGGLQRNSAGGVIRDV